MEIRKVSSGVSALVTFMNDEMGEYDPAERIAALNSAAFTIQACIQAESLKAIMTESMRRLFDPKPE